MSDMIILRPLGEEALIAQLDGVLPVVTMRMSNMVCSQWDGAVAASSRSSEVAVHHAAHKAFFEIINSNYYDKRPSSIYDLGVI